VAGVLCPLAIKLKFRFGYDDALDVIAVHFLGGILGSLLLGVFGSAAVKATGLSVSEPAPADEAQLEQVQQDMAAYSM